MQQTIKRCRVLVSRQYLLAKASTFLVMSILMSIVLIMVAGTPLVQGIRETFLQTRMQQRSLVAPQYPQYVATFVPLSAENMGASPSLVVDRASIKRSIERLEQRAFGGVLIDVSFKQQECDVNSVELLRSIIRLSEANFVVLPYSMSGTQETSRAANNLINDCWNQLSAEEQDHITDGSIFFADPAVYMTAKYGGAAGIRPFVLTVIPARTETGFSKRWIPAVSTLTAAMAQVDYDPEQFEALIRSWRCLGIETRWKPVPPTNCDSGVLASAAICASGPTTLCKATLEVSDTRASIIRRLSFRLAWRWPPTGFTDRNAQDWNNVTRIIQPDWDIPQSSANRHLVVLAGGADSPDTYVSPIGIIPGGWTHVNSHYDFITDEFGSFRVESPKWSDVLIEIAIIALGALVIDFALVLLISFAWHILGLTKRARRQVVATSLWPVSVLIMATYELSAGWRSLSVEYADQTFVIALISLASGMTDVRNVVEYGVKYLLEVILSRRSKSLG